MESFMQGLPVHLINFHGNRNLTGLASPLHEGEQQVARMRAPATTMRSRHEDDGSRAITAARVGWLRTARDHARALRRSRTKATCTRWSRLETNVGSGKTCEQKISPTVRRFRRAMVPRPSMQRATQRYCVCCTEHTHRQRLLPVGLLYNYYASGRCAKHLPNRLARPIG